MPAFLEQFVEQMFVGPIWPASIAACLLILYTLLAVAGLIDLEMGLPDFDADIDPNVDVDLNPDVNLDTDVDTGGIDALEGLGAASVRMTNFGRIPLVVWGGIFTVAFWSVSYGLWHPFDSHRYEPTLLPSFLLSIRNLVISVGVTKVFTQPMLRFFEDPPTYDHANVIGATCEIITSEATSDSGQAKFRTNAAPLLLNVRTDGPHLEKGAEAKIIGFDPVKRIYTVTSLPSESGS